ncbi:MAG: twin-arginine translocase TatA/TatE family subunit [Gemmatimonadota bacterium]|jgi:sec-independent protein translocase protein TatA|nr:twin-arginine translocase TatA/TatE family subunit [Gemmatimonadota bacterium]MDP6528651.1 twin-arginine translocase TatA/TatE family subunit [Gemmatimonadota bacterium]MDP6803064.1 twin-arginine translocase TatA/TatE family subunit [Gemmatimonadota bacterium]MDP7032023.1 twin-arginine translocase TatA/TatE family subunit [Gemmatimonadota bacterium]
MLLIGMPGGQELLIVGIIVLVLFGGTRIPTLMKGMGQGIRLFRKELKEPESAEKNAQETTDHTPDDS